MSLREYTVTRPRDDAVWLFKGDGSPSVQVPSTPDPLPPSIVMKIANNLVIRRGTFIAELKRVIGPSEPERPSSQ